MRTAFFDMDRTILSENSGKSWLRFQYKRGEIGKRYMARAVYWQMLYRMALLDMSSLAEKLVADAEGDLESEMLSKCEEWLNEDLADKISAPAVEQIRKHKEAGDVVVMITGASQFAAYPVAKLVGIEHVLCTRLEVVDGVFSGKLSRMCFGEHKVGLAEAFATEHGLDLSDSIFYTDSYNDLPMLERVGEGVAVNADARLLRRARKSGWRIENWAG
ncbi:MAG: HAD family hydrolase [Myxococcales bacterium]|nr:HAD family hydrolase [Myxococcales bacterium]